MSGEIVTRPYMEDDRDGFAHVRSMVYRGGEPVRPDESLIPNSASGYVASIGGRIVGTATNLHFDTWFRGQVVPTIGVAGVGVLPEHRKGGVGSSLMAGLNRHYREQGFLVAALYPFRSTFYRRFGYEYAGQRLEIKCPSHRLPQNPHAVPMREVDAQDINVIRPIYEKFMSRFNGANRRNEEQWSRALGMDKPFAVYVMDDPAEAYVIVRLEMDFWKPMAIREVAWTSARGYDSVLGFLSGLSINKTEISWWEPECSPFLANHFDQGVSISPAHMVMYRALDVQKLLERVRTEDTTQVRIRIADPSMPENDGCWWVEAGPDGAIVQRTETHDLSFSIQSFTQALLGSPSFESLAHNGIVGIESSHAFSAGCALFPSNPVYCADFY